MINIFGVKIIVTIGNGQDFGNNDETHLTFEEFFPEEGDKSIEEEKDEIERGSSVNFMTE